jgi:outer membrane immunogenic protein
MKLAATFLTTTAIVLATSAMAADLLPTYKAAPAPTMTVAPYSWTGFYIGVGGGASFLNVPSSSDSYMHDYNNGFNAFGGERSDLGKFAAFGTIEVGADYQMGQFVVGAFTDFDLRSLKAKGASRAAAYCNNGNCTNTVAYHSVWYKVNNAWDAGLRLGYLVTDRNLLYLLGGYSGANVSSGARLDQYGNNGSYHQNVYSSQSGWKSGYVLGAGWQTAITDHISLKTEYRYQNYGSAKSSYSYANNPSYYGGARQSGDVTVQSIRAVLDYKF